MNRLTIFRLLFAIVCICDLFTLYTFYRLNFPMRFLILLPVFLVLAFAKYPIYEMCFHKINRKYIEYSITGVMLSIAFDVVTGVSIVVAIFGLNFDVFTILKIFLLFVIVGFEIFFIFCLTVLKSMLVIDISVPSSIGKINF